ncbi:WecB/TagA/CpsF family glycosyltransferase [Candidatus Gottesmanbacteria bacterium]|nr:WecB/TagA/CpsF family glycosyltransferase [Candidatus Gottesmanbacteria bacterium]
MNKTTIQRVDILGVSVSAINYQMVLSQVRRWITKKEKRYACVAAAHLIIACQKDKILLEGVNRAGLITPDGMPLVWLLRRFGYRRVERVYGPTLMVELCTLAARRGWGVFLLGGAKGQSEEVKDAVLARLPKLQITGNIDTPLRPIPNVLNQNIITHINRLRPKLVFVGLGCPQQELWMIENRKKLDAPVLIGVGAAFDFLSGRVRQAPAWMQNVALEWLFRFLQEPGRLWYRYTVTNGSFLFLVCFDIVKKKVLLGKRVHVY